MTQLFKLKVGTISFETEKVLILDNSNKHNFIQILSLGFWTIYGTISVLGYMKNGSQFLLWTGLFIGIGHPVIFYHESI